MPHQAYEEYDFQGYSVVPDEDIGRLFSSIRQYYQVHKEKGLDWRQLIDTVRNQVPQLWKALTLASKKRFIRHVKPFWEIHRHRAPQQQLDVVHRAIREGRFTLLKGKIQEVTSLGRSLMITLVNTFDTVRIEANYLLNSSGLQHNISLTADPLLRNLLERGYIIPDSTKLGVETDDSGAFECSSGEKNIFSIGALRGAAVLECTAAKEIGEQAFRLSNSLVDLKTI